MLSEVFANEKRKKNRDNLTVTEVHFLNDAMTPNSSKERYCTTEKK